MSASTFIAEVPKEEVRLISDKESPFEKIQFSDGCGYISEDLLKIAADKHEFSKVSAI